jgi:hypothetical protein
MSTPPRARGDWIGRGSARPARDQIADVVADLSRAKWRQHCADCMCTALFVWLVAASVAVLAIRLAILDAPLALVLPGLLAACLAAGAAAALSRRPDALQVAIAADLELNLKQRLSTAWEFAQRGADAALSERLAAQAVRARLPARARSMLVFPLRLNAYGMLVPVAAIALLLVSALDLQRFHAPAAAAVDESVLSEGVRLREYGQRMEGRARREALPRSTAASQQLQQLGSRMESAALSRGEALSRLRDLDQGLDAARRAALGEGEQTPIGPLQIDELDGARGPGGAPDARAMLQRLLDGQLDGGEARALGSDPDTLARAGVSREALEQALGSFSQGEQEDLRDILERLSRAEQAREDARTLGDAREQVARARQSLGDPSGAEERAGGPPQAGAEGDGGAAREGSDLADADIDGIADAAGGSRGSAGGSRPAQQAVRRAPRELDTGPVLQARGRPGEGGVLVSQARVLPRAGQAGIDNVELDARFATQVEAVLSKEHYPAHHKEFIRRYFLSLSEGQRSQEPAR